MELMLDPDIGKVVDFMVREISNDKLLFVARSAMSAEIPLHVSESAVRLAATG